MTRSVRPVLLVIFGITGDLAQRKLLPALYRVLRDGLLPARTRIIGVTRRNVSPRQVVDGVRQRLRRRDPAFEEAPLSQLQTMLSMYQMELTDDAAYAALLAHLRQLEGSFAEGADRLYYLSIPPQVFLPVVRRLGQQGHARAPRGTVRLLVEKPFGCDFESAQELVTQIGQHFREEQQYRIDHYLAKETAQNILTFRFQNPIFEAIWNSKHIARIDVTASETLGVEGRAAFYEQTGALRDLIQSHLLQLLALTTMERPASLTSRDIHAAKLALLQAVEPIAPNRVASQAVRGQYRGYRDEVGNPDSITETFAALRLRITNQRWRGTPLYLQTGKQLAIKATEVTVTFKDGQSATLTNRLTFRIQPNEGISLGLQAKQPGYDAKMQPVDMQFNYQTAFTGRQPDAYERVLVDALRGDRTLFATSDEVLASWRIVQPVLAEWQKGDEGLSVYSPGSAGPSVPRTF